MGPKRCGASLVDKNIEVGPSAPPIIPIAPDSITLNPKRIEPIKVAKIPN